jgi:hypothetical protein
VGQTVRLAFYFHSRNWNENGGAADVAPGWYIDEVRLVHDFASVMGSSIVRTQETACVPLAVAAVTPTLSANFTLRIPSGTISNLTLNPAACWSGSTLTSLSSSEWQLTLRNNCPNTSMGVQNIGDLCFTAVATQSIFSPFTLHNLVVTNQDLSVAVPAHTFDGRTIIIGNQPLLESWRDTDGQRMVTTYGKPNTGYVIRHTTSVTDASPWSLSPSMTNLMPTGMSYSQPLTGVPSAPILLLRANER